MIYPWRDLKSGIKSNIWQVLTLFFLAFTYVYAMKFFGLDCFSFAKNQELLLAKGSANSLYNSNFFSGIPALFTPPIIDNLFFDSILMLPFISLAVGSCGVYFFLRYDRGVSSWVAVIASSIWLVLPFWQYLDASQDFTLLRYFAALPWMIFAVSYLKKNHTLWAFSWVVITFTMLFRVCDPQAFWFFLVFFASAIVFFFAEYSLEREMLLYSKFLLLFITAFLFAAFASAQPLFSFFKLFGDFTYSNDFSFLFDSFLRFFEINSFLIMVTVSLAVAVFGVKRNVMLLIFLLFFLILPSFMGILPGNWIVKNPYLLFGFSLSFGVSLFGIGLDRILKIRNLSWIEHGRHYFVFLFLSVLLLAIFIVWSGSLSYRSFFLLFQLFSLLLFVLVLSYRRKFRSHSVFLLLNFLLIFPMFAISGFHHRMNYSCTDNDYYNSLDKLMSDDVEEYRIYPLERLFGDNRLGQRFETIGGSARIIPRNFRQLIQNCLEFKLSSDLPINWNVVDMLAVKYILRENASLKVDELSYIDYDVKTKISVYENKNYRGKLWFVDKVVSLQNPEYVFKAINSADFDPFHEAIVDQEFSFEVAQPEKYSAKIIDNDKDKIQLRIYTDVSSFLVFSNNFSDDWYAFEDSSGIKIYRVNYFLQGFYVSPGLHNITLEYIPALEKVTRVISLIFLLLELVILGVGYYFYLKLNYANRTIYILK